MFNYERAILSYSFRLPLQNIKTGTFSRITELPASFKSIRQIPGHTNSVTDKNSY